MPPRLNGLPPARIMDIVDLVEEYAPGHSDLITRAYIYTAKVHRGQSRVSGEPYISHPLEVSRVLAIMRQDPDTVAAGMLHDTVEDTSASIDEIVELFGTHVGELVDGVTKLAKLDNSNPQARQAENYRKMLVAMSHDIRVILIKLADRLHNAMTLEFLPPERRERIARETAQIYAPLANRLGIGWLKGALEDVAFRHLHAAEYQEIDEKLQEGYEDRKLYLEERQELVRKALEEAEFEATVSARFKLHSSIYRKMREQNLDFHQVYDIAGLRIVVEDLKDCYAVLGILHSMWKPIQGRFKDYIALPKSNLYQSLHTTVMGSKGRRIEFQIRTKQMHQMSEEGIAAHWRYKEEGESEDESFDKFEWLRRIVESLSEESDPKNLVDSVRLNLFQDEVFVFTPMSEVKSFSRGATPVDFAYAIHSEVGHHCVGAKINGRIVPLNRPLENGDVVEILTNSQRTPDREWLKSIVTPRAKQQVKMWVRQEQRMRSTDLGRELLEHELNRFRADPADFIKEAPLRKAAETLEVPGEDELLADIGFGRLSARDVVRCLIPDELVQSQEKREKSALRRFVHRVGGKSPTGIILKGQDDTLIHFAKCCDPIPGDPIVGFITRGKGVTVHLEQCQSVQDLLAESERLVDVSWGQEKKNVMHTVSLLVEAVDRPGILAGMSMAIAGCNSNIIRIEAESQEDKAGIRLDVQVHDLAHLNEVLKKTRGVKGVHSVLRVEPRVHRSEVLDETYQD
ncbi:MAG: bifunctional (p)ppGpp synthetase/guanosine-3',5'-bis(diphosphate) 3'-pyrophosphohydrolase [Nitrospinaceae bacterium]|nr:bifunctional (p)ppGpp synthetase/guanosine-3',5'-bis(diphosphate) 3'-pyrophosphohydrolase [Nitrospinaceae bacterium]